ncbi:hypothetical protein BSLG_010818, partial [Batrachochytrium salamandrivorans]
STSSAVIAVPMVDNVYKRAVASLDLLSTEFPFYFQSVYEDIPHSGAAPSPSSEEDDAKTATDFISTRLNLGENDFKVVNSYTDSFGIGHVYGTYSQWCQCFNHQAAAHVKNGEVAFLLNVLWYRAAPAKRDLAVSAPNATLSLNRRLILLSTQLVPAARRPLDQVGSGGVLLPLARPFQVSDFDNKASYTAIGLPRRDPTDGFIGYQTFD